MSELRWFVESSSSCGSPPMKIRPASAHASFHWRFKGPVFLWKHYFPSRTEFFLMQKADTEEISVFGNISSGEYSVFRQISSLAYEIRFPNCPVSTRLLKMNIHRVRKLSRVSLLFGEPALV